MIGTVNKSIIFILIKIKSVIITIVFTSTFL